MKITAPQRNTILAALRFYQQAEHVPAEIQEIASDGLRESTLGENDIDDLCEAINTDGEESLEPIALSRSEAVAQFPTLLGLAKPEWSSAGARQWINTASERGHGAKYAAQFICLLMGKTPPDFNAEIMMEKWDIAHRNAAARVFCSWLENGGFNR